jgi:hypothetical protein
MALADPQSITPTGGSAISMPRISSGALSGAFASADALTGLSVSHQVVSGGVVRHLFRIDQSKLVTDPFTPANSRYAKAYAYLVVGQPSFGYSAAECIALAGGMMTGLTATSNALLTKVVGRES